ncbi:MAG: NADPH-dependent glutamate synthase [Thermodesulfovibrionales bacterium]
MPEQRPRARRRNFEEVALGYDEASALAEASRCLRCKDPKCVEGCPVGVPIPAFIQAVRDGRLDLAIELIKEKNLLPAVCGRVCPQESQCEMRCLLGKKNEPVAIGRLERFVADAHLLAGDGFRPELARPRRKRVAVVGSGPAGLACAFDLRRLGYEVKVFEAFHEAGGVLHYGIPDFRLPKEIVAREVSTLRNIGVEMELNAVVGKLVSVEEILKGFDACFIGTGAGLPKFLGVEGENLGGVYSANEFLTRVNLMRAHHFPEFDTPVAVGKRVAVVGGGNVAMDAVRTAIRLGAEEASVVYRRTEAEMPARREEIHHAREEGARLELLAEPMRIEGEDGWATALKCRRMELKGKDASGRPRPVPVPGSEFSLPVDTVIVAVGSNANPILTRSTRGLKLNPWGYIEVEAATGRTSIEGVYAGGDIVTGSATVISAMGSGRRSAAAIHRFLGGQ